MAHPVLNNLDVDPLGKQPGSTGVPCEIKHPLVVKSHLAANLLPLCTNTLFRHGCPRVSLSGEVERIGCLTGQRDRPLVTVLGLPQVTYLPNAFHLPYVAAVDAAGLAWSHASLKGPPEKQAELMRANTFDLGDLGGAEEPHASIGGVLDFLDDQRVGCDPKFPVVIKGYTDGGQLGVDGGWRVVKGRSKVLNVVLDVPLGQLVERLGITEVFLGTPDAANLGHLSCFSNPTG